VTRVYFIATKHKRYTQAVYLPESTVIDPWRFVPDGKHWSVHRIGENKPALISVLVPSRGRPDMLARAIRTAYETATHARRVEVVVWLDDDEPNELDYMFKAKFSAPLDGSLPESVRVITGPRKLLSECWNTCYEHARGEILMHCGDDVTFNTPGWDQRVREEFEKLPDRIGLVFGDDLSTNFPDLATHGFVHRRWVQAVGYFLPPLFSSDWNDVWISEVAKRVGRLVPMSDVVIEHHHYTFGKAERDQTHAEREERGIADGVVDLYKKTEPERELDAQKLKAVMA
jgi:Glycosyl transferase family 2